MGLLSDSPPLEYEPTLYPSLEILFGVILCCVFVTAIIGNTLTFLVVTKMNSWNNSAILFIAHLGFVDILNSLVITPFSVVALFTGRKSTIYNPDIPGNELYSAKFQWLCDMNGFMFILIRVLVPLTNLNIAIDRTIAVTLPLKYSKIMNRVSVMFILGCDWLIALGFASGSILINRHIVARENVSESFFEYNEYMTLCSPSLTVETHYDTYQTCLSVSTVIIPFIAIFILSLVVISILNLNESLRTPGNTVTTPPSGTARCSGDVRTDKRTKRTRKATQTLMMVIFLYLFFWLPYVVLWILDIAEIWNSSSGSQTAQLYLVTVATLCIICNSATNPLVFIIRSEKYRAVVCKSAGDVKQRMITVKEDLTGSFSHVHTAKQEPYIVKDFDRQRSTYQDGKTMDTFL